MNLNFFLKNIEMYFNMYFKNKMYFSKEYLKRQFSRL
jgi:hypothetical protein